MIAHSFILAYSLIQFNKRLKKKKKKRRKEYKYNIKKKHFVGYTFTAIFLLKLFFCKQQTGCVIAIQVLFNYKRPSFY